MNKIKLVKTAREIRKKIVSMGYNSGGGHIGCSLSIVDILTVLYFSVLNIRAKDPKWKNRDYLILSKGHACSALYATLAEKGFFSDKLLKDYLKNGSHVPGHVTYGSLPGIEVTAGSLGHGLSIGVGIAISLKNQNSRSRIFVIVGDGEAEEGSIWEAIMFAGHHGLKNLVMIIDNNNLQILGKSQEIIQSFPFKQKLLSFGWDAVNVDGHNIANLTSILNIKNNKKPLAVIANTTKGKGISFMENKVEWHGKTLSKEEFDRAIIELNKTS